MNPLDPILAAAQIGESTDWEFNAVAEPSSAYFLNYFEEIC